MYRIGLAQNLDARQPASFQAVYTFNNGTVSVWNLTNVNPQANTATITADCAVDLVNQQNVKTRIVRVHYPTAPNTVDIVILSVQS